MIKRLHPAIWVGLTLTVALLVRVQIEKSHVSDLANQPGVDEVSKHIYLAESARWSTPIIGDKSQVLTQALDKADQLKEHNPAGSRAIAEEVRATLYATRVGHPGNTEILQRANQLIVENLAKQHNLGEEEKAKLVQAYKEVRGPSPIFSLLSSIGFVIWLVGLALISIGRKDLRVQAVMLTAGGLISYLGFLALA